VTGSLDDAASVAGAAGPAAAAAAANDGPLIELRGVRKSFALGSRRVEALRGVDLVIERPGFYAIMGSSGSGKSTLLHLLAALDRPDEGWISIAGRRIDEMDEAALTGFRRTRIGIVFQQFNLISTLSALDNATLPALLEGVPAAARAARGRELLEALDLGGRLEHRPDALSGGEQQRVAIARALYFAPPIIFADEPTGNLDSATSEQLWSLLGRLAREHELTVFMVTHEPAAAVHCERVFLIRDGLVEDAFDVKGLDAAELATRAQRAHR